MGQLELAGGKRQEAKDRALEILKSDANNSDAQILLSLSDAALDNLKVALGEARDAVKMAPDRSLTSLNLGQIELRAGSLQDAELNFKKAKELDSKSTIPSMTLGSFYQKRQRWADAEAEFRNAIQIAPKDALPRAALATLYFTQGQESQAEDRRATCPP